MNQRSIISRLEEWSIPFIDTGIGLQLVNDSLLGMLRITTSTKQMRDHVRRGRVPLDEVNGNDAYAQNIQVADLNGLVAALAVMKWKKIFGFYLDAEQEHHSVFMIDGNTLLNEEQYEPKN